MEPPASGAIQQGFLLPSCPAHPDCSLRQINNYLTVPAHKLDSPTMSRARIGSGKGLERGLQLVALHHHLLMRRFQQEERLLPR